MRTESFRLTFTVNGDIINRHMAPSVGNVHNEILTFCMPGTTFHCKNILAISFSVWSFLSMFRKFPGLVQYL